MRRKPLEGVQVPDSFSPESGKIITKVYDFELITPMFGGDAQSWQLDEKNPVRSQSVKGQLRFWWRTMQNETDVETLLFKENEIFGGKTEKDKRIKSKLSLHVTTDQKPQVSYAEAETNESNGRFIGVKGDIIPKYVLFPITEAVKDNLYDVPFITSLKFKLHISFPAEVKNEIEKTLTLWTLFGGVGARTRRGTGSLYCEKLLSDFSDASDIKTFLKEVSQIHETTCNYPTLHDSIFAIKEESGATEQIWHSYLEKYADFRQKPGIGRNPGQGNRPGRSRWPEPDAIRRITGKNSPNHKPEHPAGICFPRAAYGLPILTEFRNADGDPKGKFMLEPEGGRWPSPMILKVIKLKDKVLKCCFILNSEIPNNIKITGTRPDYALKADEMPGEITSKEMPGNAPLKTGENPYEAIIRFMKLEEI